MEEREVGGKSQDSEERGVGLDGRKQKIQNGLLTLGRVKIGRVRGLGNLFVSISTEVSSCQWPISSITYWSTWSTYSKYSVNFNRTNQ